MLRKYNYYGIRNNWCVHYETIQITSTAGFSKFFENCGFH